MTQLANPTIMALAGGDEFEALKLILKGELAAGRSREQAEATALSAINPTDGGLWAFTWNREGTRRIPVFISSN